MKKSAIFFVNTFEIFGHFQKLHFRGFDQICTTTYLVHVLGVCVNFDKLSHLLRCHTDRTTASFFMTLTMDCKHTAQIMHATIYAISVRRMQTGWRCNYILVKMLNGCFLLLLLFVIGAAFETVIKNTYDFVLIG